MKKIFLTMTILISLNGFAQTNFYTSKKMVETCPAKFLGYLDKSEGGPGIYCACPEENLSYLDKAEGGSGEYCSETPVGGESSQDIRSQAGFIETCPEEYLTFIDAAEGGPGAYCNCPESKIRYPDLAKSGQGAYCAK